MVRAFLLKNDHFNWCKVHFYNHTQAQQIGGQSVVLKACAALLSPKLLGARNGDAISLMIETDAGQSTQSTESFTYNDDATQLALFETNNSSSKPALHYEGLLDG